MTSRRPEASQPAPAPADARMEVSAPAGLLPVPPLQELFPFPLDGFQLEAIDALNQGHSVVVSAPTGSGKTLVGEYAIHRALAHGQKVFYTTPLKALSNQKLRDFREQFGSERVGLMTGDLTVNREASVVVMTTEIFRNMLYAEADSGDDPLADVEAVVSGRNRSSTAPLRCSWWPSRPRWPTPVSSPTGSSGCMVPPVWC
ncbi:MAG: hypothetical protein RLZZ516_736 [Cyanobacteriota bacterium]